MVQWIKCNACDFPLKQINTCETRHPTVNWLEGNLSRQSSFFNFLQFHVFENESEVAYLDLESWSVTLHITPFEDCAHVNIAVDKHVFNSFREKKNPFVLFRMVCFSE